jgi:hypothetical protein
LKTTHFLVISLSISLSLSLPLILPIQKFCVNPENKQTKQAFDLSFLFTKKNNKKKKERKNQVLTNPLQTSLLYSRHSKTKQIKTTAPSIPLWSPTRVLTEPSIA